jgi:hypothetical protein
VIRINYSDPANPREVYPAHVTADSNHPVYPVSDTGDAPWTECSFCGLSVTGDGTRHGFDAPRKEATTND